MRTVRQEVIRRFIDVAKVVSPTSSVGPPLRETLTRANGEIVKAEKTVTAALIAENVTVATTVAMDVSRRASAGCALTFRQGNAGTTAAGSQR